MENMNEKNELTQSDIKKFLDEHKLVFNENIEKSKDKKILLHKNDLNFIYDDIDVDSKDYEYIIEQLKTKINHNQLIGYDLLQILENEELVNHIHKNAINYLKENYSKSTPFLYKHREEIILSLVLIAQESYDGNFWKYVEKKYEELYFLRQVPKIEKMIHDIINYFSKNEVRYINYIIRNTIIPKHFLKEYINLLFDIYLRVLKSEIPENINFILADIFISIGNKYELENPNETKYGKTVNVIKTIKEILNNVNWISELTVYTKTVLKYIDSYYWLLDLNDLPYQKTFRPVFDTWMESNYNKIETARSQQSKRGSWQCRYELVDKKVVLHIPNHFIKYMEDINTIKIVIYNGSIVLTEINKPVIYEVDGGYVINENEIILQIPLGRVRYEILSRNTILYSSKDMLYREYILFNNSNKELPNKGTYVGDVNIVAKGLSEKEYNIYYQNRFYEVGSSAIEKFGTLSIGDRTVYVSNFKESEIFGDINDKVKIRYKKNIFDLYKSVEYLDIVSNEQNVGLCLHLNDYIYRLDGVMKTNFGKGYLYRIPIKKYLLNGVNKIIIINQRTNHILFKTIIFLDNAFTYRYKIENDVIKTSINSSFINKNDYSNFDNDEILEIEFNSQQLDSPIYLIPYIDIPVYKIGEKRWNVFSNDISIKDLDNYSKIKIRGIDFDTIVLMNNSSTIHSIISFTKNMNNVCILTCEKILQYISNGPNYLNLFFYKNNAIINFIHVYYRAVLVKKSINIQSIKDILNIEFDYNGKDKITVQVLDNDKVIHRKVVTGKPISLQIPNLQCNKKYSIQVLGGSNDLFSKNSTQYEMFKQEYVFYSLERYTGKYLKINKCIVEHFNVIKSKWVEIEQFCHNTKIKILSKVDDDIYKINFIYDNLDEHNELEALLEVIDNHQDGKVTGSITYDKEYLLYEYNRKTIVFNEDESNKNDMPIIRYELSFSI